MLECWNAYMIVNINISKKSLLPLQIMPRIDNPCVLTSVSVLEYWDPFSFNGFRISLPVEKRGVEKYLYIDRSSLLKKSKCESLMLTHSMIKSENQYSEMILDPNIHTRLWHSYCPRQMEPLLYHHDATEDPAGHQKVMSQAKSKRGDYIIWDKNSAVDTENKGYLYRLHSLCTFQGQKCICRCLEEKTKNSKEWQGKLNDHDMRKPCQERLITLYTTVIYYKRQIAKTITTFSTFHSTLEINTK